MDMSKEQELLDFLNASVNAGAPFLDGMAELTRARLAVIGCESRRAKHPSSLEVCRRNGEGTARAGAVRAAHTAQLSMRPKHSKQVALSCLARLSRLGGEGQP